MADGQDQEERLDETQMSFGDHLENSLKNLQAQEDLAAKIDVPEERRFTGFDGYKSVIAECDVILLATSPHFRPLHMEAAVESGKHLFVEKPIATDAPGVRRVMAASERAKVKLMYASSLTQTNRCTSHAKGASARA